MSQEQSSELARLAAEAFSAAGRADNALERARYRELARDYVARIQKEEVEHRT